MIDQKMSSVPLDESAQMLPSAMTMSSSFTHLSMDTDETAKNDEPSANESNPTATHSFVMYDALVEICQNNVKYFECDDSEVGQRFLCAFRSIVDHVAIARQFVAKIITFVHEYDYDEKTPANGYRSIIKTTQACINQNMKVCKYIAQNRSYLLFRKNMYMK